MPASAVILDHDGLDAMIGVLSRTHVTLGPTRRGDVIVHDEIGGVADLPAGWSEEQEAGTYRLEPSGDDRLFAFTNAADSWRRHLFAPSTLLVRIRRTDGRFETCAPPPDGRRLAFIGVRGCDLAAIEVMDRTFGDCDHPDPTYTAARDGLFIVAVGCSRSAPTCFCASQGTGPRPNGRYDIVLTELAGGTILAEPGSTDGEELLGAVAAQPAGQADIERARAVTALAGGQQHRAITDEHLDRLRVDVEGHDWHGVAERCLSCGNCTLVCPTCFCSTVEDSTDLAGTTAERHRRWDSCFTSGHSYIHGGEVHGSTMSRYRQWLLHKLITWEDQFDTSGCTGCGRCITWCPVGIDLTEEVTP